MQTIFRRQIYIWLKNIPLEYWMFVYFDTSDEQILSILLIAVYVETVFSAEWSVSLCLLNIFALTNDCHNVVRFHIPRHIAASWERYWVTTLGLGWRRPSVTRPPVAVCTVTQYLTSHTAHRDLLPSAARVSSAAEALALCATDLLIPNSDSEFSNSWK